MSDRPKQTRQQFRATTEIPEGSTVILRAIVGSTVHGTSVDKQDDRDEMEIVVEPKSYVIGLKSWGTAVFRTQPEGVRSGPGDLDLVSHSLRKFSLLASRGNPTILLPLFAPPTAVIACNHLGDDLMKNRGMFLSKLCGSAFFGYMKAQRQRLMGETGSRHGRPRQELIDQYGFDTKYAGHIVRLGFQGVELMSTGHLSLPMKSDQSAMVVAIRTGKLTLQETLKLALEVENNLAEACRTTPLPDGPDNDRINEFLVYAYESTWRGL